MYILALIYSHKHFSLVFMWLRIKRQRKEKQVSCAGRVGNIIIPFKSLICLCIGKIPAVCVHMTSGW